MTSCPNCGTPVSPGTRFCGNCGTSLLDATASVPADFGPPAVPTPLIGPGYPYPQPGSGSPSPFPQPAGPPASAPRGPAGPVPLGPVYSGPLPPAPSHDGPVPGGPVYSGSAYGTPSGLPYAAPPPAYSTAPYAPPVYPQPSAAAQPTFLRGDWAGAFLAAGTGIGAMIALAVVALLIEVSVFPFRGPGASVIIAGAFLYAAMGAGGSVSFGSETYYAGTASFAFRPLTLTLVGYVLMAIIFVRRLRSGDSVTPATAWLQAARLAIVQAGLLLATALLSGIGTSGTSSAFTFNAGGHADPISTILFGTITLAVVLLFGAVAGLPGAFGDRVERARALLAGPVQAVVFLIPLACITAFLTLLVLIGIQPNGIGGNEFLAILAVSLVALPNVAIGALLFGMGVPLETGLYFFGGGFGKSSATIFDLTNHARVYWIWPIVTLVLLTMTGIYCARRSALSASGRRIGWPLAIVMPVTLLLLAPVHATRGLGVDAEALALFGLGSGVGFNLGLVVAIGAVWGIVVGTLGSLLTPKEEPPRPTYGGSAGYSVPLTLGGGYPPVPGYPAPPAPAPPTNRQ